MKIVVVDIDAILWNMAPAWYEELIKFNPSCPCPGSTKDWNFWKGFLTKEETFKTIDTIHFRQELYDCFPNAYKLTKTLSNNGYKVIIASHRDPAARGSAELWLDKHSIYYDELYIGPDKLPLLNETTLFIDDCPHSQLVALQKGIPVFSIRYPYNEHIKGVNFYNDFDSMLDGVTKFITRYVTIPISHYLELVESSAVLESLYEAGVDNWEGHTNTFGSE